MKFTGPESLTRRLLGRDFMSAVLRAIFGYCFLIFIVRIAGRRPGKQMTPIEFILIFFA
jgi:uncharacterized membrane protein YcaP (DUF421 family)